MWCGAHFNPAVTIAFAVTRHFPWRDVPAYVLGQGLGAIGGALTLRAKPGPVAQLGMTLPAGTTGQAVVAELVLSAFLMFVIVAVATDGYCRAAATSSINAGSVGKPKDGDPRAGYVVLLLCNVNELPLISGASPAI